MRFGRGPETPGVGGGESSRCGVNPDPVVVLTNKPSEVGMLSFLLRKLGQVHPARS